MFFAIAGITAVAVIEAAAADHKAFMASIEGLPEDERQRRIERREDRMDAERRHCELVRAQAQRADSGAGWAALGFVFGLACS